ncbi:flavin reductase (NADPH) isoform X3 [Procambarus clarkii]|uniref:flavin reductase (NADPH) isoform X3 n=1 Tax=Procambarus clarkii TaxID=6728 RepID=UPI001E6705F3|nr:flavin reductase (NADPH)-like isoform X3 [Procambarus clarkii]
MDGIKVVVFGASGKTGTCCTQAALNLGCEVTAFVRNPAKLPEELASQVTVKVGDVLEASSVDKAVQGQDAVVIVLGTGDNLTFSFRERTQVPERFLPILDEHERMLQALKASNLEWVAVLPPHITDEPGCGDYLKQHNSSPGRRVSKYDLGHFMVFCLSDDANLYQLCGISDKPQL